MRVWFVAMVLPLVAVACGTQSRVGVPRADEDLDSSVDLELPLPDGFRLNERAVAFPGAVGFGAEATGGRFGRVLKVTQLGDSGSGSLRWALEQSGPRIVVFETGGVIELKDRIDVLHGDLTLAGQTAPGDGIVVRGARLRILADNVIVRGMRFRPGHSGDGEKFSDRDCLSISTTGQVAGFRGEVNNVVVDHNSCSWSTDEMMTVWGRASNITFSNNLLAEALRNAKHPEGSHSMGLLVATSSDSDRAPRRVSVARNLLANSDYRCPAIRKTREFEFINNFCFNFFHRSESYGSNNEAHFIKNYYENAGNGRDDGKSQAAIIRSQSGDTFFLDDNRDNERVTSSADSQLDLTPGAGSIRSTPVFSGSGVPEFDVQDVRSELLATAGARWPRRDDTDQRILTDVRDGFPRRVNDVGEVGGYPTYSEGQAPTDSDGDGMPDDFEEQYGLDPTRNDAAGDTDRDGFTNIEEYINGLISGFDFGDDPAPSPPSEDPLFVEAEHMTLSDGYEVVERRTVASGAAWIETRNDEQARASFSFPGVDGEYVMTVGYFDENDGRSQMEVIVEGRSYFSWRWQEALGSRFADKRTRTTRTFPGRVFRKGSSITLEAIGDGFEPARLDYVRFQRVADSREPTSGEVLRLEAEELTLDGFEVGPSGLWIESRRPARASWTFDGPSDDYDIVVAYYDENDGESRMELRVSDQVVDTWTLDQRTSSPYANPSTLVERVVPKVALREGDRLQLSGTPDSNEPVRTDYVELRR
ncbi:MAG: hypothetical protein AAFQ65_02565 [Myxococcota bacterium]